MPRFKHYDYNQTKMVPIAFDRQILPGSFEYTLDYLVEHELVLSIFDQRYCHDNNGCPAYDPRILLKIIILAYSKGVIHSRKIEALCRDNILFMALSADSQPHFTTIANFIFMRFRAHEKDCPTCPLRGQCLRSTNQKSPRVVNINLGVAREHKTSLIEKMKQKIDSSKGRHHYSKRLGIVEPVFDNINTTIGINRFLLRGKNKVNGQWQLMTMIHNLLKIHRYGWEWQT